MQFRSLLLAACCLLVTDVGAAPFPSHGEWPSITRKHRPAVRHRPARVKKAVPPKATKGKAKKKANDVEPPAASPEPAATPVPVPVPNPASAPAPEDTKKKSGTDREAVGGKDKPTETETGKEAVKTGPSAAPVPLPIPNPTAPPPAAKPEEKPPVEPPAATTAPVPLPVPKPLAPPAPPAVEKKTAVEPPTADPKTPEPPAPEAPPVAQSDPDCDALTAGGEVEFKLLPAINEGACGAPFPISLIALTPRDGRKVTFETPVVTRCVVAQAALTWMRETVQPSAQKYLGEPIKSLRSVNGYQCRGRNRVVGAKLSEHGKANAIDIGGFQRASGPTIMVTEKNEPGLSFLLDIRAKACGPFKTVLGPGSDSYHATHFHFDSIQRGKTKAATYCH